MSTIVTIEYGAQFITNITGMKKKTKIKLFKFYTIADDRSGHIVRGTFENGFGVGMILWNKRDLKSNL